MVDTSGTASIEIEASADSVYALLTDFSRISELSPECYKMEWEEGANAPEVGAKFRGFNRNGGREWEVGCVVIAANPGAEWAFDVPADSGPGSIWRYVIEPTATGCRVTESFDSPMLANEFFQKMNRHDLLMENISATLANLKAVAEA